MHDLDTRRLARSLGDRSRRADDGAHLHLVDLGPLEAEAAPTRAEHRVRLAELLDPAAHRLGRRLLRGGKELVERWVEEPDRDGIPGHRFEDRLEVALLDGQEQVERRPACRFVGGEDHLLDDREPIGRHEHVLRAAEPDALGAELARLRGVGWRVGVRTDAQATGVVGPPEDGLEVLVDRGWDERHRADDHATRAAVDRQQVALA